MVLATLKTATQVHHDRIEAELDLLRPDFTLADYRTYLCRTYGYYQPWEVAMKAAQALIPLLPFQPRLHLIEQDLQALGLSQLEVDRLPLCRNLPPLLRLPHCLGSLYVIEGASLGGLLLTRHFTAALSFPPEACAFLSGQGKETMPRWRAFGKALEALVTGESEPEVIASACATFQSLREWYGCREALAA